MKCSMSYNAVTPAKAPKTVKFLYSGKVYIERN